MHVHTGIDGNHGCRCSAYPHLAIGSNPIKDSNISVSADASVSGHHGHTDSGPGHHDHKKTKTRGSQFCVVLCICMEDLVEAIKPNSNALRIMSMQVSYYVCVCMWYVCVYEAMKPNSNALWIMSMQVSYYVCVCMLCLDVCSCMFVCVCVRLCLCRSVTMYVCVCDV
jgi:hypothetical protein